MASGQNPEKRQRCAVCGRIRSIESSQRSADKSTLIKLICGFYPPTAGSIQWNVSGRKPRIVGVFQDFARLPLNTLDNMVSEEGTRTKETLHLIGLDFLQSM